MASKTDYLEGAIIDHVLRNTALTSPTTVYVSLHSAAVSDDGTGAELAVSNGYVRQSCAFDAPHATLGTTQNTSAVTFTASGGAWSAATHFAIWDASAAGNMLYHAALDASRTAGDGDSITFAIGDLDLSEA